MSLHPRYPIFKCSGISALLILAIATKSGPQTFSLLSVKGILDWQLTIMLCYSLQSIHLFKMSRLTFALMHPRDVLEAVRHRFMSILAKILSRYETMETSTSNVYTAGI